MPPPVPPELPPEVAPAVRPDLPPEVTPAVRPDLPPEALPRLGPTVPPHPGASSPQVSARMSVAARRDTAPEVALRRALHAAGYRFRVVHPVPGNRRRTIDIAFPRARVAVFVDGCFWHGCPEHGTRPRANSAWWTAKLAANRARDEDTDRLLREAGWLVVRVWEHESVGSALTLVRAAVDARARGRRGADPQA